MSDPNRKNFERDFMITLLADAATALQRFGAPSADVQAARRELVRSLHATVEGIAWTFREHVKSVAMSIGALSAYEEIALGEESVHVTEQGKISRQRRSLTLVAAIRLTVRIAVRSNPELEVRFDTNDWAKFQVAIATRNRVTHPKTIKDLEISASEIEVSIAAFYWFLDLAMSGMEATNVAMRTYLGQVVQLMGDLKAGDPEARAAYQSVIQASWE